jgi:dihydrofolate reductase
MNHPQAEQTTGTNDATLAPMRKIIALMHLSLDGFAAGPNGELEWAAVNEEMYQHVADLLRTVDTAVYGRVTYQMMESYWPTVPSNPASTPLELRHAHWVEKVQKIVFSRTMERAEWNNTRVIKENIAEEVAKLKQQPGKNLMIFGSLGIVHMLMHLGLIDEYRLTINPIVLGSGIPLFEGVRETMHLKLLEARTFPSGVVGLHYRKESHEDKE